MSELDWRKTCRYLAEKYGFTPEQVGNMPDAVLFDMVPGWAEEEMRKRAEELSRANGQNG